MPITKEDLKKHGSLKNVYFARADLPTATKRDLEIAVRVGRMNPTITSAKRKKNARSRLLDIVGAKKTQAAVIKRNKRYKQIMEE